jgi:hypothetical protein
LTARDSAGRRRKVRAVGGGASIQAVDGVAAVVGPLSHLQFEVMIVAARTSTNPFDFAPVAMLGLLGLRVFEACNN